MTFLAAFAIFLLGLNTGLVLGVIVGRAIAMWNKP